MIRTLVIGALACTGLAAWDAHLGRREASVREESVRVRRLVPEERVASMRVAGLSVRKGGATHVYAQSKGIWRCLSAHGAIALPSSIATVMEKLTTAEGVVQCEDPTRAALYGFHDAQRVGLSMHGTKMFSDPDGDVLLDVEIGLAIPGTEGSYVRERGAESIWAVDRNLRQELAPAGLGSLPPLLDPSVTPAIWTQQAGNLRRIVVAHSDPFIDDFELQRVDVERTEDELERGYPEWEWTLVQGSVKSVCEPLRVWAYERFFSHIPYRGVLDPVEFEGDGAPRVRARIQVYSDGADPIELRIFDRHRIGGYPVLNSFTGTVSLLSQEIYDLLVPDGRILLTLDGSNPWEPWLKR